MARANAFWPTAVVGEADSVNSVSASACHIGGPKGVTPRYDLHKSPQSEADGGNLTNFWQLLVMACELPRQETDHSVTTHAPTQVTAGSS